MTEEIWKPVPEYEQYKVSNHGRLYNSLSGNYIKGSITNHGVRALNIETSGTKTKLSVPVLVARLFIPDYKEGVRIRFLDGDKLNAHVDNLEPDDWLSREPRESTIEPRPWATRVRIIDWDQEFDSVRLAADALGTHVTGIYKCLRGEQHTHLGLTFEKVE